MAKTGLPDQKIILYCRRAFHEQFKFLRERVINNSVLGWILGPPGTGKSSTALAFAATLDRNEWVVTWIHLQRENLPLCVRLENGSKKARQIQPTDSDSITDILAEVDESKQHIVFLDGYVLNGENHVHIKQECFAWRNLNREKRRMVVVSSMSARYKAKAHEDMVSNTEEFFVFSWKEEEYLDAVKHSEFFENVRGVLDAELPGETEPSPEDLVRAKFYFAGGSARWMFQSPTKTVIDQTNISVANIHDIIPYIGDNIGDQSNHVINRLVGATPSLYAALHRYTVIISQFAAAMLAMRVGPDLIRRLHQVTRGDGNPAMDGWIFEMWFLACLRKVGVELYDRNNKLVKTWPPAYVGILNINSFPELSKNGGIWCKPDKWNQGGFDVVYMDKKEKLVMFLQVTSAATHSLKLQFFHKFLQSLDSSPQGFHADRVEIYFVVDYKKRDEFKLANPTGEGLLEPFGWQRGKEKEQVQILFLHDWTSK